MAAVASPSTKKLTREKLSNWALVRTSNAAVILSDIGVGHGGDIRGGGAPETVLGPPGFAGAPPATTSRRQGARCRRPKHRADAWTRIGRAWASSRPWPGGSAGDSLPRRYGCEEGLFGDQPDFMTREIREDEAYRDVGLAVVGPVGGEVDDGAARGMDRYLGKVRGDGLFWCGVVADAAAGRSLRHAVSAFTSTKSEFSFSSACH